MSADADDDGIQIIHDTMGDPSLYTAQPLGRNEAQKRRKKISQNLVAADGSAHQPQANGPGSINGTAGVSSPQSHVLENNAASCSNGFAYTSARDPRANKLPRLDSDLSSVALNSSRESVNQQDSSPAPSLNGIIKQELIDLDAGDIEECDPTQDSTLDDSLPPGYDALFVTALGHGYEATKKMLASLKPQWRRLLLRSTFCPVGEQTNLSALMTAIFKKQEQTAIEMMRKHPAECPIGVMPEAVLDLSFLYPGFIEQEFSAVYVAAFRDCMDVLNVMFEMQPDEVTDCTKGLYAACRMANPDVVQFLLDKFEAVKPTAEYKEIVTTAVFHVCSTLDGDKEASEHEVVTLKYLLQKIQEGWGEPAEIDVLFTSPQSGDFSTTLDGNQRAYTAFELACGSSLRLVKFILEQYGEHHRRSFYTASHHAACRGKLEILDFLLSTGLALSRTPLGKEIMDRSIQQDDAVLLQRFLEHTNAEAQGTAKPWVKVKIERNGFASMLPLLAACKSNAMDCIEVLLAFGADYSSPGVATELHEKLQSAPTELGHKVALAILNMHKNKANLNSPAINGTG